MGNSKEFRDIMDTATTTLEERIRHLVEALMNDLRRRINEDPHLAEVDVFQQHLTTIQSTISAGVRHLLDLIQREFTHFNIVICREVQYLQEKVVREVDNILVNLELTERVLAEPRAFKSIMQEVIELKDSIQDRNMVAKTQQEVQEVLANLIGHIEVNTAELGETLRRGLEPIIHDLNSLGYGVEVQRRLSIEQQKISSSFVQLADVIKERIWTLHCESSSETRGTGNNIMYRLHTIADQILRTVEGLAMTKKLIFTQELDGLVITADHILLTGRQYGEVLLSETVQKTATALEDWILKKSADPIVNGHIWYSKAPVMPYSWITHVLCSNPEYIQGILGFLSRYGVDNLDLNISINDHQVIDLATLVNPRIFNSAVDAYLKLRRQYPDYIRDDANASKLSHIIARAQNTLAFISNIQSNALFVKLFQNHMKAITSAQYALNKFLLEFNSDLDAELRQKQDDSAEIQKINIFNPIQTIFASFADRTFKYPYRGDTAELRDVSFYVVNKRVDFIRRLKDKDCLEFNMALEELSMTVNAIKVYAALAGVPEDLLQTLAGLCTKESVVGQLVKFLDATTIDTPLLQMPTEAIVNATRDQILGWADRARSGEAVLSTPLQQLLQHIIDETVGIRTAFLQHELENRIRPQATALPVPSSAAVLPAAVGPRNYAEELGIDLAQVLHDYNQVTRELVNAIIEMDVPNVEFTLLLDGNMLAIISSNTYTPLHIACYIGNAHTVTALLTNKANRRHEIINAEDAVGNTPLMLAAQRGYLPIVEHLCAIGAEFDHRNDAGITAQEIARTAGHGAIVEHIERVRAAKAERAHGVPAAGRAQVAPAANESAPSASAQEAPRASRWPTMS